MQQWEYTKIDLGGASAKRSDTDILTSVGNEGWELVAITINNAAYLKRPVASAKSSTPAVMSRHCVIHARNIRLRDLSGTCRSNSLERRA